MNLYATRHRFPAGILRRGSCRSLCIKGLAASALVLGAFPPPSQAVTLLYSEDFTTTEALHDTDTVGDGTGTPVYNTTPTGPAAAVTQLQSINAGAYQQIVSNEWQLTEASSSSGDGLFFQVQGQPTPTAFNWATSSFAPTILAEGGMSISFDVRYSDILDNNTWVSLSFGTGNAVSADGRRYDDADVDFGFRFEGDRIDQKKLGTNAGTISYPTPLTDDITVPAKIFLDFTSFALGANVSATMDIDGNVFSNNFTWEEANDFRFSIDASSFLDEDSIWIDNLVVNAESSGLTIPNQWSVDGGGSFNTAGNWTDNVVPTVDATFGLLGLQSAANAPATVTLDSAVSLNSVIFNNENTYILDGPQALTLTGDARVTTTVGGESHEIRADIAGTAGLEKTGPGNLVLIGAKSYTGTTDVLEGTLRIDDLGAIDNQASGALNIGAGATVLLNAGATGTLAAQLTGESTVEGGDATLTINNNFSPSDTVTINRSNAGFGGVIRVNGGTLAVGNNNALGDGGESNDRTVVLAGTTAKVALTGGVTIANEVLDFEGRATDDVALTSSGSNAWNGVIRGEGNNTLSKFNIESTSGTLTLNELFAEDSNEQFSYVFSGAGNTTVTGRISDANVDVDTDIVTVKQNDNVGVVKRGSGTLTIGYATTLENDYWFGPTTIEEGTMVVNSSGGGADGELRSSSITVNSGATLNIATFSQYTQQIGQDLRGSGSINVGGGNLRLISDAGNVAPGDSPGEVGELTVTSGSVLLADPTGAGTGTWSFDVGNNANTSGDLLNVQSGAFTASTSAITVNVTPANGHLDAGSRTIVSHTGGANATLNSATAQITDKNGNPLTTRQTVAVSGSTAGQVNVVVTGEEATRSWNGNVTNAWDVSTSNWTGGDNQFRDLDHVTFNDSATTTDVTLAANRAPGSMTFNNSTPYTFTGEGGIVGTGSITLNGTGEVALANEGNDFSGATTINAGSSLRTGSASTGSITNSGTLSLGIQQSVDLLVQNGAEEIGTGANYKVFAFEAEDFLSLTENAPGLTTWTKDNTIAGSSDGEALYASELTSNTATSTSGQNFVTYDMKFTEPGDYIWFHRMVSVDGGNPGAGDDDSFFAPTADMDSGNTDPASVGSRVENFGSGSRVNAEGTDSDPLVYDWYRNAGSNEFDRITVTQADVDAGTVFSFKIATREGGMTLDKFAFVALDDVGDFGATLLDTDLDGATSIGATQETFTASGTILDVNGDFTMGVGSTLNMLISTPGTHDQLNISGMLTADGTLNVAAGGNGFAARAGDVFDIFSFASATGAFADILLPTLGAGLGWDTTNLLVTGELEVISVGLLGDFNGDGVVDSIDYAVWRENLGMSDAALNGNGTGDPSGLVVSADFDLWRQNYGATSASATGLAVPTPEPSSLLCLLAVLSAAAGMRRWPVGA